VWSGAHAGSLPRADGCSRQKGGEHSEPEAPYSDAHWKASLGRVKSAEAQEQEELAEVRDEPMLVAASHARGDRRAALSLCIRSRPQNPTGVHIEGVGAVDWCGSVAASAAATVAEAATAPATVAGAESETSADATR
jgi:hypothetical protein